MQYPDSFKRNYILIRTLCNLLGEIYREVSFALPGIWTIIPSCRRCDGCTSKSLHAKDQQPG